MEVFNPIYSQSPSNSPADINSAVHENQSNNKATAMYNPISGQGSDYLSKIPLPQHLIWAMERKDNQTINRLVRMSYKMIII